MCLLTGCFHDVVHYFSSTQVTIKELLYKEWFGIHNLSSLFGIFDVGSPISIRFLDKFSCFDEFTKLLSHDLVSQIRFEPLLYPPCVLVQLDHTGFFDQGFTKSWWIKEEFLLRGYLDSIVFNIILHHLALNFLILNPFNFLNLPLEWGQKIFGFTLFSNHVRIYLSILIHHIHWLCPDIWVQGTKCYAFIVFVHSLESILITSMSSLFCRRWNCSWKLGRV